MLGLLKNIVEIFTFIPDYILYAIESAFNIFTEGITAVFVAAAYLVPMPSVPSPPEWVSELNWFFPLGAVITVIAPILAGYVTFLGVRWILTKSGEL